MELNNASRGAWGTRVRRDWTLLLPSSLHSAFSDHSGDSLLTGMDERLPGGRWSAELETGGDPASVAKEAVDCGLLVSECQLTLFRLLSLVAREEV